MTGGFSKRDFFNFIILIAVIIFVLYNMFTNAYIGGTNDLEMHAYNLAYLKDSLVNNYKIPAWTSDFYGGKPFLGLYPPLSYYLLLPVSLIFSPVVVPKICFFLIFLISGFFFYLLAKHLFKDHNRTLMATFLFVIFPNKLRTAGGGALAQSTAVVFVPLMFLIYEKWKKESKLRYLALMGLIQGLCLLTHHAAGMFLMGAIILFMIYDYIFEKRSKVIEIIPFLLIGVLMALVFLIPAYQIQSTVNADVVKETVAFKAFNFSNILFSSGGEYLGILAFIIILFSLSKFVGKEKDVTKKYIWTSFIFFLFGLYFYFLLPSLIKSSVERAERMFSVLGTTLPIIMVSGISSISEFITKLIDKYKLFHISKDKEKVYSKINKFVVIILVIFLFISFIKVIPSKGNELEIPSGLYKYYKELSNDEEYYRIEDQIFSKFGFSSVIHKHGMLNGAPLQEAPKYHFYMWSSAWNLLQTDSGRENFASLYGLLSIKYFVSDEEVNILYFKEFKTGYNYKIYENEKFLPYVRAVPNIIVSNLKEPDYIVAFLQFLSKQPISFDKVVFVRSNELEQLKLDLYKNLDTEVDLLEREPGYLKVDVSNIDQKTVLVVAESYHPYWKATQNGKELKVYEGIPSTLIIPIGEDGVVEVEYAHTKLKVMLFWFSLIITLFLVCLIIYDLKKHGK